MYIRDVYQPFVHICAKKLAFGALVHHQDDTFEQVDLFSMREDNRKIFSEAMRFEGMRLHESDADSMMSSGVITPLLTVARHPRDVKLFSSNFYFEIVEYDGSTLGTVLSGHDLVKKAWVKSDAVHAGHVRPMRSLLATAFAESDRVYTVFDHCLADFLNEADMEIKEYVAHWNRGKLQHALLSNGKVRVAGR